MHKGSHRTTAFWTFLFALLLASCQGNETAVAPTPLASLTPAPTQTTAPSSIGSPDNPLIIGLVGDLSSQSLQEAGLFLAEFLSEGSGQAISYRIFPNYHIMLVEMAKSTVHITFLPPMTYLYAQSRSMANVHLIFNHFGLYAYGTQFFVHAGSDLNPYFDESTQSNIGDAITALSQLQGKRPCYVSPDSVSGHLIPAAILQQNGIRTQEPVYTFTPAAAIRALYITGVCDFAATYAVSGDPRTSASVISDLTDVQDRLAVLWRSDPVIPELNISIHPDISESVVDSIITSFLVLSQTAEGSEWLSAAAQYETGDLQIADDTHYSNLAALLEGYEFDIEQFVGK